MAFYLGAGPAREASVALETCRSMLAMVTCIQAASTALGTHTVGGSRA
jgi:hypothetical protein